MSNVGHKRLPTVANHLDMLQRRQLAMNAWFSLRGHDFVDIKGRRYDTTIANVQHLTTECGFAACAVGHAAGIRSIREQGLKLVYRTSAVVDPTFTDESGMGWSGWDAVERFFNIDHAQAVHLFAGASYSRNVAPQTVARRIRKFVKDRQ